MFVDIFSDFCKILKQFTRIYKNARRLMKQKNVNKLFSKLKSNFKITYYCSIPSCKCMHLLAIRCCNRFFMLQK